MAFDKPNKLGKSYNESPKLPNVGDSLNMIN